MRGEQIASVALVRHRILPLPFPPNYPKFDLLALNKDHEICSFLQVKYNADTKPIWKTSNTIEMPSGKRLYYIFIHDDPITVGLHVHFVVPEKDTIQISKAQEEAYVALQRKKNPNYKANDMRSINLGDASFNEYREAFDQICQCLTPAPAN